MKINEIITEGTQTGNGTYAKGNMKPIDPEFKAGPQNAQTYPNMNMSTGSAYMGYRFGLALAGAPNYPTKAEADNWIGGDPLLTTYTDIEQEMVNAAAMQVGAGRGQKWSNKRSEEIPAVNKTSVVAKKQKNKYGV